MNITDLGGHSGCKILLFETEENVVFVRKISCNAEYNNRLRVQAEKQASFKSDIIRVPAVLNQGYTEDGLYYFDMEYVQGITMAEYMKSIEIGKVRGLVETVVKNIVSLQKQNGTVDEMIFFDKIDSLKKKLASKNNPVIYDAIELLSNHSWVKFVNTTCHGDLTLENIIVKDNQLYLIDFLDSFYDCWIMDISTLMQDVQTMWSYHYQDDVNINTLIRLIVFRDILIDTVKKIAIDDYMEVYYALLLKLIRIYPYTKDERTYQFLNEKVQSVMNIIRKEEETCVL